MSAPEATAEATLPPRGRAILETNHLTKQFGGLTAVDGVSFRVPERSIVSIIGPNGAGKTTFFNMLTGLYKPTLGTVTFDGRNVTGGRPDVIMKLGMARTFQNIRLFGNMSALDNVLVGMHSRLKASALGAVLRLPSVVREEREARERARELLAFTGLTGRDETWARNLPYGDQRRLEIARALATQPTLLLLDEP